MLRILTLLVALLTSSLSSTAHSFDLLTREEVAKTKGEFLLKDLGVGDKLQINRYASHFCTQRGKLHILSIASSSSKKKNQYSAEFTVTLLPKKKVSLEIIPPSKGDGVKKLKDAMIPAWSRRDCDAYLSQYGLRSTDLLLVEDINGFRSERAYVDHLISQGFTQ